MDGNGRRHAIALWALLGLFCVRVAAQLVAAVAPIEGLPAFEDWASGALPYPGLVAVQLAIIGTFGFVARKIGSARARRRPRLGRWLSGLGSLYFGTMLVRFVLGLTLMRGHWWLDKPLPSFFHLVLAGFLLVVAHFHLRGGESARTKATCVAQGGRKPGDRD